MVLFLNNKFQTDRNVIKNFVEKINEMKSDYL